jgi:hypothetical protein
MATEIISLGEFPLNEGYYEKRDSNHADGYPYLSLNDSKKIIHGVLLDDGFIHPVMKTTIKDDSSDMETGYAYNETQKLWEKLATSTGGGLNFTTSESHQYPGYCM